MLVTQDLHVHTNLSLCACKEAILSDYVDCAAKIGLDTIAITNHYWEPGVPGGPAKEPFYLQQNYDHICEIKEEIKQLSGKGVRILFGAESEYSYEARKAAITEKTASQLDFLLVPNSHTHITMPRDFYCSFQRHADYMVQAYHDILNDPVCKYISAIPHPFAAVCCPYNNEFLLDCITDSQFKECFDESVKKNVAIEINLSSFWKKTPFEVRNSGYMRMFEIARDCGCKFTFGSDAHSIVEMQSIQVGNMIADFLKLTKDQIYYV